MTPPDLTPEFLRQALLDALIEATEISKKLRELQRINWKDIMEPMTI